MEHSSFFNSVNHDRRYKAEDWAEYFNSFISNGVFPNPSTNVQVTADGTSMKVAVQAGKAWINGFYYYNDSPLYLTLTNADGATNRIDRIVLRWSNADRQITAAVKQSAYATTPTAPDLERDADYYEIAIADVYVGAGVISISQANITDQRPNSGLCGWVDSLIEVDSATLYTQFTTQFYNWFNHLKTNLDGDTATNLQNEIDSLKSSKANTSTLHSITVPASGWNGSSIPYSQTINIDGVTATSANEILPGTSLTKDQIEILQAANLQDGGQSAGNIVLEAYGEKPGIDLPLRVVVRGDL